MSATYKVGADSKTEGSELEVRLGLGALFRRRGLMERMPVELPEGTLHAYLEGAAATFCGVDTAKLALFPNIDWPGGVELSDRRCSRCGESTADQ